MAEPFYRYTDEDGRVHIVDRLDKVPAVERARAQEITPGRGGAVIPAPPVSVDGGSGGSIMGFASDLDGPSVLTGVALAVAVQAGLLIVRRNGAVLLRGGLVLAAVALIGGAYLGWIRQRVGVGDGAVATPGQLVDDARRAVRQLKARLQEQQRVLRELEGTGR